MAWTTLPTYTDGTVLTAAMMLAIRDNINATAPALATQSGSIFVGTGANSIGERLPQGTGIPAAQSTTSTTFGDLGTLGPGASYLTGTKAIVGFGAQIENNSAGNGGAMSFATLGASVIAANAGLVSLRFISGAANERNSGSVVNLLNTLTPGVSTFAAKYMAVGSGSATFQFRELWVMPL
jgi:hypothetical protein